MNLQSTLVGNALAVSGPAVVIGGVSLWLIKRFVDHKGKSPSNVPPLPEVPRLPLIGNLSAFWIKCWQLGSISQFL